MFNWQELYNKELVKANIHGKFTNVTFANRLKNSTENHGSTLSGTTINLQSHLVDSFETNCSIFYFFANNMEKESIISLLQVRNIDGQQKKLEVARIFAHVTCLHAAEFGLGTNEKFILLIGTKEGMVKWIDVTKSTRENNLTLEELRINHKKIIQITFVKKEEYNFIALSEDNTLTLCNIYKSTIIRIYKLNLISNDLAKGLAINYSRTLVMQYTRGGNIILWKLDDNLSDCRTNKWHTVPYLILNDTVIGIKWAHFYQELLAIIDVKGMLKIIAINHHKDNQYLLLLEHQIDDPESISSVKIIPSSECFIICKSHFFVTNNEAKTKKSPSLKASQYLQDYIKENEFFNRLNYSTLNVSQLTHHCHLEKIQLKEETVVYTLKISCELPALAACISDCQRYVLLHSREELLLTHTNTLLLDEAPNH